MRLPSQQVLICWQWPLITMRTPTDQVQKIKARMLLHYAQNDDNINKGINAYNEALDKAGIKYELRIYEGAQHAFNNDASAARYNKAAADLAWSRTISLFKQALA